MIGYLKLTESNPVIQDLRAWETLDLQGTTEKLQIILTHLDIIKTAEGVERLPSMIIDGWLIVQSYLDSVSIAQAYCSEGICVT